MLFTYKNLEKWFEEHPDAAHGLFESEDEELMIACKLHSKEGEVYYRVDVYQNNGWIRIHTYWKDGTVEERYKKDGTEDE